MTESKQYKMLKNAYSNQIKSIIDKDKHYHPYLITTRFTFIPLSASVQKKEYKFLSNDTWTTYSKIYRHLISNLSNNFTKKPYLHPKTFDFLDVDGTSKNPHAAFTTSTIPHIHSIYLIHEQTLDRFRDLAANEFQSVVLHHSLSEFVRTIHAEPITSDLPKVVSYCSKFYDNFYARPIRDDYPFFNQFPLASFEKESLKHQREHLPFNLIADSNREIRRRFSRLKTTDR